MKLTSPISMVDGFSIVDGIINQIMIWEWLKIKVPNDQEWAYLVGNHLFGVSIILSHIHLEPRILPPRHAAVSKMWKRSTSVLRKLIQ